MFSEKLEEELAAVRLSEYLDRSISTVDNLVFGVFENERRHLAYGWGNTIGVHVFPPVFDRYPFSNANGTATLNGLSSLQPLSGYDWLGEWTPQVAIDGTTDDEGYQYADFWASLGDSLISPATSAQSTITTVVRRRKWARCMVRVTSSHGSSSIQFNLFTLNINIKEGIIANLKSFGVARKAYVEIRYGSEVMGKTEPQLLRRSIEWKQQFSKKLTCIDPTVPVECHVIIERPILGSVYGKAICVGVCQIPSDHLWSTRNKTLATTYTLVPDGGTGELSLEIRLDSFDVFSVRPIMIAEAGSLPDESFPAVLATALRFAPPVGESVVSSLVAVAASQLALEEDLIDAIRDISSLREAKSGDASQSVAVKRYPATPPIFHSLQLLPSSSSSQEDVSIQAARSAEILLENDKKAAMWRASCVSGEYAIDCFEVYLHTSSTLYSIKFRSFHDTAMFLRTTALCSSSVSMSLSDDLVDSFTCKAEMKAMAKEMEGQLVEAEMSHSRLLRRSVAFVDRGIQSQALPSHLVSIDINSQGDLNMDITFNSGRVSPITINMLDIHCVQILNSRRMVFEEHLQLESVSLGGSSDGLNGYVDLSNGLRDYERAVVSSGTVAGVSRVLLPRIPGSNLRASFHLRGDEGNLDCSASVSVPPLTSFTQIVTKSVPNHDSSIILTVQAASGLFGSEATALMDVYFAVYLLDKDGKPISPRTARGASREESTTTSSLSSLVSGILTGGNRQSSATSDSIPLASALFRSNTIKSTLNPHWDAGIKLKAEDGLHDACSILIELWSESSLRSDACIGEIHISLCDIPLEADANVQRQAINVPKKMSSAFSLDRNGKRKDLGCIFYVIRRSEVSMGEKPIIFTARQTKIIVDDYVWPAQLILPVKVQDDSGEFHVRPDSSGLILLGVYKSAAGVAPTRSEEFLANCKEAVNGDVVIPWSQISLANTVVLTESFLMVQCKINRKLRSGISEVFREVVIDIAVCPCPSNSLRDIIDCRVRHHVTRAEIASLDYCDVESLQEGAKKILFELQNADNGTVQVDCCNWASEKMEAENRMKLMRPVTLSKIRLRGYFGFVIEELAKVLSRKELSPTTKSSVIVNSLGEVIIGQYSNAKLEKQAIANVRKLAASNKPFAGRLEDMIFVLAEDVSDLIVTEIALHRSQSKHQHSAPTLSLIGANKGFLDKLSERLTCLIHNYYVNIISYLNPFVEGGVRLEHQSDTQSKNSLLRMLIAKDDWIDSLLTPYLGVCELMFSKRPLLSHALNFDSLVSTFSIYLNAEVIEWERKAIEQYSKPNSKAQLSSYSSSIPLHLGRGSGIGISAQQLPDVPQSLESFIPWEVLQPRIQSAAVSAGILSPGKFISNIPENIRYQLNIQIGAKRISPCSSLSGRNLKLVERINSRIVSAVSSTYLRLSDEYQRHIVRCSVKALQAKEALRSGRKSSVKVEEKKEVDDGFESEIKVLEFLVSAANDSARIVSVHIPECESELTLQARFGDHNGVLHNIRCSFESVCKSAISSLMELLFDDLRDEMLSNFDSKMNSCAKAVDSGVPSSDSAGGPIEIVIATIRAFVEDIGCALEFNQLLDFLAMCCRRLCKRLLLFVMDCALLRISGASHLWTFSLADRFVLSKDVQLICSYFSEAGEAIISAGATNMSADRFSDNCGFEVLRSTLLESFGVINDTSDPADLRLLSSSIAEILVTKFSSPPPSLSLNQSDFDSNLIQFLREMSPSERYIHGDGPTLQIQVSDITCINLKNYQWKVYTRLSIGEDVRATRFQFKQERPAWEETLIFSERTLENKWLLVEVVEKLPFRVLKDHVRASLRIPLSGIDDQGGSSISGWYQLLLCEKRFLKSAPNSDEVIRPVVSRDAPMPSAGPRTDIEEPQIRLRIKVMRK